MAASFPVDDAQVLEAALSFLDDYVGDGPSASTEQDVPAVNSVVATAQRTTTTSTSVVPAPRCKISKPPNSKEDQETKRAKINERKKLLRRAGVYGDPNRARNARRQEIAFLREQIEKLTLDLQTLQSKTNKISQYHRGNEVVTRQLVAMHEEIPSLWHAVADRQRRRREEVELENARLKLAVDRHTKMADSLKLLMKRRASQLVNECSTFGMFGCPQPQIVRVMDFHGDIGEFQSLFRQMEAAHREIDAVFAANGLANMVISPSDVHIREGVGGKYLELFANKVLPFGLQDATEAAWNHFKGTKKHSSNGSIYEKSAKNLDKPYTIVEAFTKELFSNSSRADIKVKQVVKRFVEQDRDIVIWISRVSPAEIKHKILRGLTYHLQGYALTKRSAASTPDRELSQLQFCSLISLDQETGMRCDPANVRTLANFLIANTVQNIRNHQERIESALVDRALQKAHTMN